LRPRHEIQQAALSRNLSDQASPDDTAASQWTSDGSGAPAVRPAASPYTGAAAANPYLGSSAGDDALDPARTLRLLKRAKRDLDFVRWISGVPDAGPARPMQYVAPAADAPRSGAPMTGIDDAVDQPAPFNRPPASSSPLPSWFTAPRRTQGTYWSLLSPPGALLTAGDLGAVNNPAETQTWPRVSNSHVSLAGDPVYPPPPPAAPAKPSPPIAALEDAGLPQPTASPIAPPPPITDDRSGWPSVRPAWSAPSRSQYWQAQHGIDTGPAPMDRAKALARTENTRRLASEGWEAGYGDQPIIPYQWATASNTPNPLTGVLWNMGTVPMAALDTTLRTARGGYLGAIGALAGAAGDVGLAGDPDELARALPETINVIGAATAQPELTTLPRFPVSTAVRFAARYPGEAVAGVAEPYRLNRRPPDLAGGAPTGPATAAEAALPVAPQASGTSVAAQRPPLLPPAETLPEPNVSPSHIADFRARYRVAKTHTVAVGRTNVLGLEDVPFDGASPAVWKEAGEPPPPPGKYESPSALDRDRGHAEEGLFNQFDREVKERRLRPSDIEGKLVIHISNPKGVCTYCRSGLDNPDAPAGIIKQFSVDYPKLTIEFSVATQPGIRTIGPSRFSVGEGKYIWRNDR
jgi:hypothetical protein